MLIMQIIDISIGLIFVYALFSFITSSILELIMVLLKERAKLLELALQEIFKVIGGDPKDFLKQFYKSVFIAPLFQGDISDKKLPAYIPSTRFASAIIELSKNPQNPDNGFANLLNRIKAGYASSVTTVSSPTAPAAPADTTPVANTVPLMEHDMLARYFDENMQRVTSWYRRYTRWWLFAIGLLLAVSVNIDTVRMVRELSQSQELRESIVKQVLESPQTKELLLQEVHTQQTTGQPCVADGQASNNGADNAGIDCEQQIRQEIVKRLNIANDFGLPIGWTEQEKTEWKRSENWASHILKCLGWLLTAVALSIGASSWFDLLNQLINLRTSVKPEPAPKPDLKT